MATRRCLSGAGRLRLLNDGWDDFLPYRMSRHGGLISVKIGLRSLSDVPFYRYSEIIFRRSASGYVASRYAVVSENECDHSPSVRVTYTIDFDRSAIVTELDPAWTSDGKGRRYTRQIKLRTSNIYKLSDESFDALIASAPGNNGLCENQRG